MIIKIFLPEKLYKRKKDCELFGEVEIGEASISYYITSDKNDNQDLRKLGDICSSRIKSQCEFSMRFQYNEIEPTIYLSNLNVKPSGKLNLTICLYDELSVASLISSNTINFNDINFLSNILTNSRKRDSSIIYKIWYLITTMVLKILDRIEESRKAKIIGKLFCNSFTFEHIQNWRNNLKSTKLQHEKMWTAFFDIFAGIGIVLTFLYIENPGKYLIEFSNYIVVQIQYLLNSLKGSPAGLKLNLQLNNFFLDCFQYHVNLWSTFLIIISPAIQYLFKPIIIIGFLGLSFQLAILSDLITLISLHAHCFYIYASVLYKIEIVGIKSLWKVVVGRRKNILKDRVESHDYIYRQLYLTTMFFTIWLFLLPTILIYFIVFACLKYFIYFITYIISLVRKKILIFPIEKLIKRLFYKDFDCIEMEFINSYSIPTMSSLILRINVNKRRKNA